jgi:hypothetical protein
MIWFAQDAYRRAAFTRRAAQYVTANLIGTTTEGHVE